MKKDILNGNDIRLKSFTQWALAVSNIEDKRPKIDTLMKMLFSNEVTKKQIAAWV